jgi:toxin ParE1/3/4
VTKILVQEAASWRIDEIYRYTRDRWGTEQAFDGTATRRTASRFIPADFGVEGYYFRYERHYVYWRVLSNGDIGIVTILHERMHQIDRFTNPIER